MKRIKVIQIGIGHDHAALILDSLIRQRELFEVAALAVPESEAADFADRVEKYRAAVPVMTVEEAFSVADLDAVVVETEEENLTKYALMAVERGYPVHMDKPGGLDAEKFEAMIRLAEQKQTVFHLGYMYRYNPTVTEAIRKAKSGELGEIYSVEAHMDCWHTPEKRQWLSRFPGGMMFFLGCHLIDIILQIMGEPEEVIPMNASTGIDQVTGEDYGFAVLRYRGGVSFAKTCAEEPGGFERRQLVICGSKGTVELRPMEEYEKDGRIHTGMRMTTEAEGKDWTYCAPVVTSRPVNRYDPMMAGFAKMVCGELQNPFGYDYEIKLYQTLLRCCGEKIGK